MKTIKKRNVLITIFLAFIMLLQGCKAYYKDSVTLEQAVIEHKRAKVETVTKQAYKFQSISFENEQYYGVKMVKGEIVKILIDQADLSKVRLENKSLSVISTIGISVLVGLAILVGLAGIALSGGVM
ncbi:MAG: excinuclease UvrABC helicase subunit UvrB [Mariniflexile sp.]|jgi:excinuclease UvrABC helicase subunit UvrB